MNRSDTLPLGTFAVTDRWRPRGPLLAYGLLLVMLLNFLWAGGHDDQRLLQLSFLFGGACVLAYRAEPRSMVPLLGRAVVWTLFGFFSLGILSSLRALSPTFASYETSSLFLLLLLALGIARKLALDRASIIELLKIFGMVACVYAFKIVAVYVSVWLVDAKPATLDFTPGFSNIRHLNHVQTAGLPLLALVYVLTPNRRGWRRLWMGGAVVWWAILFATGGRGAMLALGAGSLVALALRRRAALPLLRAMAAAALMGALVYLVFFWLLPRAMGLPPFGEAEYMVGRSLSDPVNGRRLLWANALELIQQHPWLGVGPLHFAHYGLYHGDAAHPHNWMLQIGAEWGLPALGLLCVALVFAARGLWRARERLAPGDADNQNMFAAWILIGTALLVDGLVSGNIVMPQSQLAIVLYLACAAGWTWSFSAQAEQVPAATVVPNIMRIVILVAAFFLANSVATDFLDRAINGTVSASSAAGHLGYWWTRLWMDTHF